MNSNILLPPPPPVGEVVPAPTAGVVICEVPEGEAAPCGVVTCGVPDGELAPCVGLVAPAPPTPIVGETDVAATLGP